MMSKDNYWLYSRLYISHTPRSPFRYMYMKKLVSKSSIPKWIIDKFEELSKQGEQI